MMEELNYIFLNQLNDLNSTRNKTRARDWRLKTKIYKSIQIDVSMSQETHRQRGFRVCVYEYGWWDDPTTPSPSCDSTVRVEVVQRPCPFPAVMNSSLSGCRAAEQRGSFVPRPSQAGRPIDDMLGLIRDCGPFWCLFHFKSITEMSHTIPKRRVIPPPPSPRH